MKTNDNPDHPLLSEILACETQVWQALTTGDAAADTALLTPDFLGVYPSGLFDRAGHAAQLADGPSIASYAIDQAQVRALNCETALLVYRATFRRSAQSGSETMYVSSLWHRTGAGWRNSFSQDTPAE